MRTLLSAIWSHTSSLLRAAVALATVLGGVSISPAQAAAATSVTSASAETRFVIQRLQNADGSIRDFRATIPGYAPNKITPYFANFAVMGLAREAKGNTAVAAAAWRYLTWYKTHQVRDPKKMVNGVSDDGAIYDYTWDAAAKRSVSRGSRDSVDSYAATYLMALRDMYVATGDKTRTRWYADSAAAALRAMLAATDPAGTGLTLTSPEYRVIYAMDNAEVHQGLVAAHQLGTALGYTALSTPARAALTKVRASIEAVLWDKTNRYYAKAAYQKDPATGRQLATGEVNWSGPQYYGHGVMAQVLTVALDATRGAADPRGRNVELMKKFTSYRSPKGASAATINCAATGLKGGYWLEDAACSGALAARAFLAAGDRSKATQVYGAAACELSTAINGVRRVAAIDGVPCRTKAAATSLLSSTIGQALLARADLKNPTGWRVVAVSALSNP